MNTRRTHCTTEQDVGRQEEEAERSRSVKFPSSPFIDMQQKHRLMPEGPIRAFQVSSAFSGDLALFTNLLNLLTVHLPQEIFYRFRFLFAQNSVSFV